MVTCADLAEVVAERIETKADALLEQWQHGAPVRHFVLDELLPEELARSIFEAVPPTEGLLRRSSLRERKKVGIHFEQYDPIIGSALRCFQEPRVVAAVARAIGSSDLHPDPSFYASGISAMERGDFLNPHLDNSHDGDRRRYRALNLLYYVSPGWALEDGGNLEMWPPELDAPKTVVSRFNRLVVMETNQKSFHSVTRVEADATRWCISNYYFSDASPIGVPYRHVTSFSGRPEEPVKKAVLRIDSMVLNAAGRALPFLTRLTRHRRRDS